MDTLPPHDQNDKLLPNPGVYIIVNTTNGGIYIGSSVNVRRRWNEHRSSLRKKASSCVILQSAWNKYGEDAFVFAVLEYVDDKDSRHAIEQKYIDTLKPEYNAQPQVNVPGPRIYSDETRAKISAAHKGRKQTEEQKAHMREIMIGRKFTPEWIEHLKEAQARRVITDEDKADFQRRMNAPEIVAKRIASTTGKTRSPESVERMRDAAKRRHADPDVNAAFLARMQSPEIVEKRRIAAERRKAVTAERKLVAKLEKERERQAHIQAREELKPAAKKKVPPSFKGRKHTPEAKQIISEKNKGRARPLEAIESQRQKMLGFKHTPEAIERIRQAHTGKTVSAETREKLRQANLGKKHSDETKAKVSAAGKGRKFTEEHRNKISEAKKGRKQKGIADIQLALPLDTEEQT